MRLRLRALLICSVVGGAGVVQAKSSVLERAEPIAYPVLKAKLRAEMGDAGWQRFLAAPMPVFKLKKQWIGEEKVGFVKGGKPGGKARRPIRYLYTEEERAPFRVRIERGLLIGADDKPFGTGKPESHIDEMPDGTLFARELTHDEDAPTKWAHSSYPGGGPLRMSAEVTSEVGRVVFAKNRSGHYRAYRLAFVRWLIDLEERGLDLSRAEVAFDPKSVVTPKSE